MPSRQLRLSLAKLVFTIIVSERFSLTRLAGLRPGKVPGSCGSWEDTCQTCLGSNHTALSLVCRLAHRIKSCKTCYTAYTSGRSWRRNTSFRFELALCCHLFQLWLVHLDVGRCQIWNQDPWGKLSQPQVWTAPSVVRLRYPKLKCHYWLFDQLRKLAFGQSWLYERLLMDSRCLTQVSCTASQLADPDLARKWSNWGPLCS